MINDKIKTPAELKKVITVLKRKNKSVGFTNGCFDILHYGHVKYLEDAKKMCDSLIVAINDDNSVQRLKGNKRPLFSLKDRMRMIASLASVDYVTSFKEDTPAEIISCLKPDIVIKGSDYNIKDIVGGDIVKAYGGKVLNVPFRKGYSVTSLIKRIVDRYGA